MRTPHRDPRLDVPTLARTRGLVSIATSTSTQVEDGHRYLRGSVPGLDVSQCRARSVDPGLALRASQRGLQRRRRGGAFVGGHAHGHTPPARLAATASSLDRTLVQPTPLTSPSS